MTRRRALALLAVGGGIVVIVVVVFASGALGGGSPKASSDNPYPTARATVTRRTLSSQTQVNATLAYADPSTIVAPAGTAPSAVAQAQQAVTTANAQVASARASAAADAATLAQARATLAADRQKLAVDCAGDAGATSPSSSTGGGGDAGSSPCATDAQTVTSDQQAVTEDAGKSATDSQAVSSAATSLTAADASVASAGSSETLYGASSTYTQLPPVGRIVHRGQTLYEVDGQPVVLLYGSVAPWRAFAAGMPAGRDVAELNANLRELGYPAPLGDAFTSATAAAIEAFQSARGTTPTGALPLGSVVFEPGAVRVTSVTPTLGATVQPGPVLGITSTVRQVTIALDAAEQTQVKVGDQVSITLPDNSTTPGRVSYVGSVATTPSDSGDNGGGSSTPTIEVDVTPTDPAATGRLDQAPVLVSITEATVKNVLVVPVDALLALASGGYALEEIGAGGVHHLVGVNIGLFDDAEGFVQVSGNAVAVGQTVVVPAE